MKIQNLSNTRLKDIVACTCDAFSDYFVKMPSDVEYWRKRYKGARVNYELSFGVFDQEKLVAFIINGIDTVDGTSIAFNTGTGVIEAYRGKQLVDKMYEFANPFLKKHGIQKCQLEVIQKNGRAIRVYERIGFKIQRGLNCFKGEIIADAENIKIQKVNFQDFIKEPNPHHHFYSWDNVNPAILNLQDNYETYIVNNAQGPIGHFVINPTGYVAQLEAKDGQFTGLMNGIAQISKAIRINNVDDRRTTMIEKLEKHGIANVINQYEMEMDI